MLCQTAGRLLALSCLYFIRFVNSEEIVGIDQVTLRSRGVLKGSRYSLEIPDGSSVFATEFLGIPYGKPPTGDLRFKAPVAVDPLTEEFDARTLPKTCWQHIATTFEREIPVARLFANNTEMSEDCLYLNVWAPANNRSQLPVMIWIHGGAYSSGSSTLDVTKGLLLAASQDVIVVSMQYRLGPFGFLYLSGNGGFAPGNMGLLDQQLAIKWVVDNIASFGGDPKKLTLFGQSSGAACVSMHYLSPTSRGMFDKMILESGNVFNRWALTSPEDARDQAHAFVKATQCPPISENTAATIGCLKGADVGRILAGHLGVFQALAARRMQRLASISPPEFPTDWLEPSGRLIPFALTPTIDGTFLPKCPEELLADISQEVAAGAPAPKVIIGNNFDEALHWLVFNLRIKNITFFDELASVILPKIEQFKKVGVDFYRLATTRFIPDAYLEHPVMALSAVAYGWNSPLIVNVTGYDAGAEFNKVDNSVDLMRQLNDFVADMEFTCGSVEFAKWISRMPNSSVWFYQFEKRTEGSGLPLWSRGIHGEELQYVFGMPFSTEFGKKYYNFTDNEKGLSGLAMWLWANFARTGNVNKREDDGDDDFGWTTFHENKQRFLGLSSTLFLGEGVRSKTCDFWNNLHPSITHSFRKYVEQTPELMTCPHMDQPFYKMVELEAFVPPYEPTSQSTHAPPTKSSSSTNDFARLFCDRFLITAVTILVAVTLN